MKRNVILLSGISALCLAGTVACDVHPVARLTKPKPDVTFKPQEVTDALHAVIAADRAIFAREIVQKVPLATVPLHATLLRQASEKIQHRGAEFHYVLRSLTPINSTHGPQTEIERAGLKQVQTSPESTFYSEEFLGGRRYFTAVYADRAEVSTCVECHNSHPKSPRHDYRLGDVMGGIVVRVPLEF